MFSGLTFFLHGNMAVALRANGGLMVRIDPAERRTNSRASPRGTDGDGSAHDGRVDHHCAGGLKTKHGSAAWVEAEPDFVKTLPPKWLVGDTQDQGVGARAKPPSRCALSRRARPTRFRERPDQLHIAARDADVRYVVRAVDRDALGSRIATPPDHVHRPEEGGTLGPAGRRCRPVRSPPGRPGPSVGRRDRVPRREGRRVGMHTSRSLRREVLRPAPGPGRDTSRRTGVTTPS